jgi:oxygen-independent coproporphyrinogen-3 oxidase
MNVAAANVEHLYVHVPFCAAKCHYCAFYSEAGSAAKMEDYVDAVLMELERFAPQLAPSTIFFGGGTPSLLPAVLMRRILEAVGNLCSRGVSRGPTEAHASATDAPLEWTIECNPSTVSTEKAKLFREFGVNRISMGVQALDDELLDVIGRVHSVKAAVESYRKLRDAGFDNVNLDFMFGLPGQTMEHWRNTLERAIALQPEHISTYCLILEEDTEFWRLYSGAGVPLAIASPVGGKPNDANRSGWPTTGGESENCRASAPLADVPPLPNDDEQLAMYETGIEMLTAAGYRQYEISNFAKPSRECAHNIAYWEGKDYVGLGPSACSTVRDLRWQNVADVDGYVQAISHQLSAVSFEEAITTELRAAERAAFGMRMNAGVPAELVRGRWDKEIAELLSAELVQWRQGRLEPTKRGILFADEVAANFV